MLGCGEQRAADGKERAARRLILAENKNWNRLTTAALNSIGLAEV